MRDSQKYWDEADQCIRAGEFARLNSILHEELDEIWWRNDGIPYLFYLSELEREDAARGVSGILRNASTAREAVDTLKELRRRIFRVAFCPEYDPADVLRYVSGHGVSVGELSWTTAVCTQPQDTDYVIDRLTGGEARREEKRDIPWTPGLDDTLSFIICTNDPRELEEAQFYLNRLEVPSGLEVDIWSIPDAPSLCAGYNHGMKQSRARYKVYLHHDLHIVNRWFLYDLIGEFRKDARVGMIGMVGPERLDKHGAMAFMPQYGNVLESRINSTQDLREAGFLLGWPDGQAVRPIVVDGILMATQYDIPWREDLFDGWHFYDASQSMEFRRRGYDLLIPYQEKPWCHHDFGNPGVSSFHHYMHIFQKEYLRDYAKQ